MFRVCNLCYSAVDSLLCCHWHAAVERGSVLAVVSHAIQNGGARCHQHFLRLCSFVSTTLSPGICSILTLCSYGFGPLFILFERDPPLVGNDTEKNIQQDNADTALLIPCYKSAELIAATLEAALKIFPAENIFVIANGNSVTPLDNTEEVCAPYGVTHVWCSIGSKIIAQYIGCHAARDFENVLVIDDDCALPSNFPVVTDRFTDKIQCIGYTIKSVGPASSKGTLCQQ